MIEKMEYPEDIGYLHSQHEIIGKLNEITDSLNNKDKERAPSPNSRVAEIADDMEGTFKFLKENSCDVELEQIMAWVRQLRNAI